MTAEQMSRFWAVVKKVAGILGIGIAYYLFVEITGLWIPCVFYRVTGIYCPGCGVSRMCKALLKLDFAAAFEHNALVIGLLPIGLGYGIYRWIAYTKSGKIGFNRLEQILLILTAVIVFLFWILRNTPQFSWLAP